MKKRESVAGGFKWSFEFGRVAVADSGGATCKVNKNWIVPQKFVSALERCENFILKHRKDRITKKIMDKANVYYRRQLKKMGVVVVDEEISCAEIGNRFISAEPGEELESECLAKAFYKGKEYDEYINFNNTINEIFDGELRNAIVIERD